MKFEYKNGEPGFHYGSHYDDIFHQKIPYLMKLEFIKLLEEAYKKIEEASKTVENAFATPLVDGSAAASPSEPAAAGEGAASTYKAAAASQKKGASR